jgi:hypothetical protein
MTKALMLTKKMARKLGIGRKERQMLITAKAKSFGEGRAARINDNGYISTKVNPPAKTVKAITYIIHSQIYGQYLGCSRYTDKIEAYRKYNEHITNGKRSWIVEK